MLLLHGMSEKSVILHEEINSSQADAVSVVGSARSRFAISINLHVPLKKKFFVDMDKESPGIRVMFWNSLLLEIMAKLMKMLGKGRHRRWGCRCCSWCCRVGDLRVGVAGFHFLRNFPGRRLEGLTLSECVFDTDRPPQCDFLNLHTSLAFGLLE